MTHLQGITIKFGIIISITSQTKISWIITNLRRVVKMVVGIILASQIILLALGTMIAFKRKAKLNNTVILPMWVKAFLSLSLIAASWLIYKDGNDVLKIYSKLVFWGMVFSAIGDLIRAGIIKAYKSPMRGVVAFLFAHIMYIWAYILTAGKLGYSFLSPGFYIGIIFYEIIFWLGWIAFLGRKKFKYIIKIGLICYGSFLCIMASIAASLAWSLGGSWIVIAFGAFFFFISDFLIGIIDFGKAPIKYRHIWVWIAYILGQIGIIYTPWIVKLFSS